MSVQTSTLDRDVLNPLQSFTIQSIGSLRTSLGESPLWDPRINRLICVDIDSGCVHVIDPVDGQFESLSVDGGITSLGLRKSGGYIATSERRFLWLDEQFAIEKYSSEVESHLPRFRFNDGKVGPNGMYWAGSMDRQLRNARGSLYRLNGPEITPVDEGYIVTNGPCFSPNGQIMYHASSLDQLVYCFDHGRDGRLSNKRVFRDMSDCPGSPDGMACDSMGRLYVAQFGGGRICRFRPEGDLDLTIKLPVSCITSLTFGPRDSNRLFATSAFTSLSSEERKRETEAGAVFAIDLDATGLPPTFFDR